MSYCIAIEMWVEEIEMGNDQYECSEAVQAFFTS